VPARERGLGQATRSKRAPQSTRDPRDTSTADKSSKFNHIDRKNAHNALFRAVTSNIFYDPDQFSLLFMPSARAEPLGQAEQKTTFCEQKVAKKLY
jgi:hypothetical protein